MVWALHFLFVFDLNKAVMRERMKTVQVTVVAGAAGNLDAIEVDTFSNMDLVTGFYIPASDAFAPDVRMGLDDGTTTIHEKTNLRHYAASLALPHDERFFPVNLVARGKVIRFPLERSGLLAADVTFDIVIRHEQNG